MSERFGCSACWPQSPDAAYAARKTLDHDLEFVDESHYHVMTLRCPACSQAYLSVFTETVDMADGDDSQYWITLPLKEEEYVDLMARGPAVTEADLNALAPDRRSLARDHPKGTPGRSYWRSGVTVGRHD